MWLGPLARRDGADPSAGQCHRGGRRAPPADEGAAAATRPAHYVFVPGNVLEGLPFPNASFDFVHQRLLIGALPADRWPRVIQELRRVTRPRGWIELVEANIKVEGGGRALSSLGDWVYKAVARRGIDPSLSANIGVWLRDAGLAGVQRHEAHLPLGRRYGRLGYMMEANHFALFDALKGPILATGITTPEVFARTMEEAATEVARGGCSVAFYAAYGQLPAGS